MGNDIYKIKQFEQINLILSIAYSFNKLDVLLGLS